MRALPRLLRFVLGGVVAVWLMYVVAVNLLLSTRWLRDAVSASPQDFRLDYARAYSFVPGRAHVDGLTLRGQDSSIEWAIELDRCDFRIRPFDLLRRRFHATHVRGSGFAMRLRLRLGEDEATPELLAALPPIPGYADPPLLPIGPPQAPLTDANYRLWSVELEDVDAAHVREVWIHTTRYAGDVHARGRWLFRPMRWLDVGPLAIDVNTLEISRGATIPLFSSVRGVVEGAVHPFDLRERKGIELLGEVSMTTALTGDVAVAGLLRSFAPGSPVTVDRAVRPLEVDVTIDHGLVRPGSRVVAPRRPTRFTTDGVAVDASVSAELRVRDDRDGPRSRIAVAGEDVRLAHEGRPLAHATSIEADGVAPPIDLAHPSLHGTTFLARLHDAEIPHLVALNGSLPGTIRLDSGSLRADGRLAGSLDEETGHGAFTFAARDLAVVAGATRVSGSAQGTLRIGSASARELRADLSGSEATATDARADLDGTSLGARSFDVRATTLRLGPGGATLDGALSGRGVALGLPGHGAPDTVRAPELTVRATDVEVGRRLAGRLSLELPRAVVPSVQALVGVLPKGLSVARGSATLSARVDGDLRSLSLQGDAELVARGVDLVSGGDDYQGDLVASVHARRQGPDGATTSFAGSAAAFTADEAHGGYWLRASLPMAALRLVGGPVLRGVVHAEAKDASPVQSLLARDTPVPRWILEAFPTQALVVDGEVAATASTFEARGVLAKSQGTSVRLEYVARSADKRGLALLRSGGLRMGFTFAGEGPKVLLFGAEGWFQRQVASLGPQASAL